MSIGEILKDFRSIKLSPKKRRFIDDTRAYFEAHGNLPIRIQDELRRMVRRYNRQFRELHASRERARRTNWRVRSGISREEEQRLIDERRSRVAQQKADLGI